MREAPALTLYRGIFVAYISYSSAMTAIQEGTAASPILWLAATEIIAALCFLWRRTQIIGLALLLAIFALAFVLETIGRDFPVRFIYFAATAWFIVYIDRTVLPRVTMPTPPK